MACGCVTAAQADVAVMWDGDYIAGGLIAALILECLPHGFLGGLVE